jgi:hypothetical protein
MCADAPKADINAKAEEGAYQKKKKQKNSFLVSELCAYLSFLDLSDGWSREQYISFTCLFTSEVEQLTQVGDESGFLSGYTATEEKDWKILKIGESSCMCEVRVHLARVHG